MWLDASRRAAARRFGAFLSDTLARGRWLSSKAAARILFRACAAALTSKSGRATPTAAFSPRAFLVSERHLNKSSTEITSGYGWIAKLPMALRIIRSRNPIEQEWVPRCKHLQYLTLIFCEMGIPDGRGLHLLCTDASERPLNEGWVFGGILPYRQSATSGPQPGVIEMFNLSGIPT